MEYIYKLDPTPKKFICPNCEKRTFVKYINQEERTYFSSEFGRCDREEKCGYFLSPKKDNTIIDESSYQIQVPKKIIYDTIPKSLVSPTLKGYETNNFVTFLENRFGFSSTNSAISKFLIGSSKHQFRNKDFTDYVSEKGATIFWEIDISGKVRTGKLMLYHPKSGKRVKEPFPHFHWVHSILKYKKLIPKDFKLGQCLFGEHQLIKNKTKDIGVVESEKTAIILSILIPETIWLATGGAGGLSKNRFQALTGKKVTLYPDLGQYEKWNYKSKEIVNCSIKISEVLEKKATDKDRTNGYDLADYLLKPLSKTSITI